MPNVFEITAKCTGCGVCISACPEKAIEFLTENYVKKAKIIEKQCKSCGRCEAACRFGHIKLK